MAIMHSKLCTLVRQGANQSWGFRLQGGSDYKLPLTVQKVAQGSISECRGLQTGDTILQIGRERTIDMTHQDAQDAVIRAGNRLDLVVLRSVGEVIEQKKREEPARISALVHNPYNSPMGLYSTENITNQLITQAQVLTKGTAVGASTVKQAAAAMNSQTTTTVKRSEVYRMVHEEEEEETSTEEEEEEEESSASPSPTNRRPGPAPAAPPKPSAGWRDQGATSPQGYQQQQQRPLTPQQQQRPQYQPQSQPQVQQQQRPQYQAQPQQRPQYQPQPQQQQQRPQYQPQPQQQPQQQQRPQYQPQYQPPPQQKQDQNSYNASFEIKSTPAQNGTGGSYRPGPGPTFQSVIPVQSSSPHTIVNQVTWSPAQERGLPVWPPQKNDAPIPTSSQSFKFSGGAGPSKKFIWPPPKDYVEITEEYEGDQRRTIYHHVKDPKPNPARVYVSPRSPARLAEATKEPYSKEYKEVLPPRIGYIGRNLRKFDDIFESNSTRLPPTYRAPPGTHYVPC